MTLTPEANDEVKRNLAVGIGAMSAFILVLVLGIAATVAPISETQAWKVGTLILIALALPMLAVSGALLTLAYPMKCWPGFLRTKRLTDLYGIDPAELSPESMRRRMRSGPFWKEFAKGVSVGSAFVVPCFLAAWATSRKGFPEGFLFPCLMLIAFSGGLSAKAWAVRTLVAERGVG